ERIRASVLYRHRLGACRQGAPRARRAPQRPLVLRACARAVRRSGANWPEGRPRSRASMESLRARAQVTPGALARQQLAAFEDAAARRLELGVQRVVFAAVVLENGSALHTGSRRVAFAFF